MGKICGLVDIVLNYCWRYVVLCGAFSLYYRIQLKSIVLEYFCKGFSRESGRYSRKWILRVGQTAFEIRLVILGKFFAFSEP